MNIQTVLDLVKGRGNRECESFGQAKIEPMGQSVTEAKPPPS
jgi:hypothetical protein